MTQEASTLYLAIKRTYLWSLPVLVVLLSGAAYLAVMATTEYPLPGHPGGGDIPFHEFLFASLVWAAAVVALMELAVITLSWLRGSAATVANFVLGVAGGYLLWHTQTNGVPRLAFLAPPLDWLSFGLLAGAFSITFMIHFHHATSTYNIPRAR